MKLLHFTPIGYSLPVYAVGFIYFYGLKTGLSLTVASWLTTLLISSKILGKKWNSENDSS